jgi:hypothetical protein
MLPCRVQWLLRRGALDARSGLPFVPLERFAFRRLLTHADKLLGGDKSQWAIEKSRLIVKSAASRVE